MFIMAGIGLLDLVENDTFVANDISKHMVAVPSAQHGMFHL